MAVVEAAGQDQGQLQTAMAVAGDGLAGGNVEQPGAGIALDADQVLPDAAADHAPADCRRIAADIVPQRLRQYGGAGCDGKCRGCGRRFRRDFVQLSQAAGQCVVGDAFRRKRLQCCATNCGEPGLALAAVRAKAQVCCHSQRPCFGQSAGGIGEQQVVRQVMANAHSVTPCALRSISVSMRLSASLIRDFTVPIGSCRRSAIAECDSSS